MYNVGEIAPKYQPAHSHADTLSCEISVFGMRLFVNSGVSTYEESSLRHYQRSTKSHNTLEYDKKNSSQVWKSFRIGKKAKVINYDFYKNEEFLSASASHNGYSNFLSTIIHKRKIIYRNSIITIQDNINSHKKSYIFWHLHPSVEIVSHTKSFIIVKLGTRKLKITFFGGTFEIKDGFWYPSHGKKKENFTLKIRVIGGSVKTNINYEQA